MQSVKSRGDFFFHEQEGWFGRFVPFTYNVLHGPVSPFKCMWLPVNPGDGKRLHIWIGWLGRSLAFVGLKRLDVPVAADRADLAVFGFCGFHVPDENDTDATILWKPTPNALCVGQAFVWSSECVVSQGLVHKLDRSVGFENFFAISWSLKESVLKWVELRKVFLESIPDLWLDYCFLRLRGENGNAAMVVFLRGNRRLDRWRALLRVQKKNKREKSRIHSVLIGIYLNRIPTSPSWLQDKNTLK